jgi:predicted MPP superfamily phosphohydrolase
MRFLIIALIWLIIDVYCFQAIKTSFQNINHTPRNIIFMVYWLFDILLITTILYLHYSGKIENGPSKSFSILFGLMVVSIAPKLVITPILLIEDITRILFYVINKVTFLFSEKSTPVDFYSRRKIVSQIGLGIASIPFLGLIYGIFKGKYNYKIHHVKLYFDDLPISFEGFKITQLSDIHSGSFTDKEAVEKGIHLANQQKSDLIVFTGDLVNNKAEEMDEWIESFLKLEAPYGKYSILGNHDYGDYIKWESEEEKEQNLNRLKEIHKEIGFDLLLNSNRKIKKGSDEFSLVGVENWGLRGFHQYGDLNKALIGLNEQDFKILLSHDPSHWEEVTLKHKQHIHLTLSGHTHGMQFGIEIPGFIKWSPIKYIYKQWAGAYRKNGKYIYVNRGFGFLGYPGRVGIMPEITVIQLHQKQP